MAPRNPSRPMSDDENVADPFAARTRPPLDIARRLLIEFIQRETPVTLRVLRAFPEDELDMKPHPRSQSARDLCWIFVGELRMALRALRGDEQLFAGGDPPTTLDGLASAFEDARDELVAFLDECSDEDLAGTVPFPVAPGRMADWPRTDFIWLMLHDQIHHRGQLSVYLRMAGGKVPSIYGPSADEPWS